MKLTNEYLENSLKTIQRDFHQFDMGDGPFARQIEREDLEREKSLMEELLEHRRLSEVSGDLEKRIMEGGQAQLQKFYDRNQHGFANSSTKHISLDFHDGAHFVIPLIRAESKTAIEWRDDKLDAQKRVLASQAAEIEELKLRASSWQRESEINEGQIASLTEQVSMIEEELRICADTFTSCDSKDINSILSKLQALRTKGENGGVT